jgi:MoxR-like ATPase
VLDLKFNRIQFTPDLMPSDITGTETSSRKTPRGRARWLRRGQFANIVLADEINARRRDQAAL